MGMGSSGRGKRQRETFPSSGSELLYQLSPLLGHIHTHHSGRPCSAAIKTPEGLYWPKGFEVFSSRPVRNARVVLTQKAEELHAYPTKGAKLASKQEVTWQSQEAKAPGS